MRRRWVRWLRWGGSLAALTAVLATGAVGAAPRASAGTFASSSTGSHIVQGAILSEYRALGKVERLNRTLLEEWAYKRLYTSERNRRAALSGWLHHHNHHRPHTALGNLPPITRCTNVSGQYT